MPDWVTRRHRALLGFPELTRVLEQITRPLTDAEIAYVSAEIQAASSGVAALASVPKWCPICGSMNLSDALKDWFSHPEDGDVYPDRETHTEYQCRNEDCGRSFWV